MTIDSPSREQLPALRALWREAFGDGEEFLDRFTETAFSPDRCRCVTEEGRPVAALYWFDCAREGEQIAYLYAIATARSHRGRGLCSALMEDTHRHLCARGFAAALLVPGEPSLFTFYEKLGYRVCCSVGELACRAGEEALSLREIDTVEYARRRRELLPLGGVIQEGENLRFLSTLATLYAGDGVLLAAQREGDTLHGLELLGDPRSAPAILRELGCSHGRFRVPADERPFAMIRPLGDRPVSPTYFGLAFD